jgi:acetyltransferase-like isoleucine patch superfamily enzyme
MPKRNIDAAAKLGKNVTFYGDITIHKNTIIGNNVTFYPNVIIGENTQIFDGAVIGRPPKRVGNTTRPIDLGTSTVEIGAGCVIGANCVLYTDISLGDEVLVGDVTSIREGCHIGNRVVVGRGVMMMYDTTIQDRSRIIDGAIITGNMLIESDVFIGPGVNTVNDNDVYLRRFNLIPFEVDGPTIRRFAVIGTGANISAGVEIGMGALVAPSAMVTHDVPAWTVVAGIPARELRKIDDETRLQVLHHFNLSDEE